MPALKNAKHELFAQEVAKGAPMGEAFKKAGYAPSLKNAQRLRKSEGVSSRIDELLTRVAQKVETKMVATIERTLEETARLAFSDITDVIKHEDGRLMLKGNLSDLPPNVRACISSLKESRHGIEVKFHNKTGALDMLHKHFGSYKTQPQEVTVTLLDLVRRSYHVPVSLSPPPLLEHEPQKE